MEGRVKKPGEPKSWFELGRLVNQKYPPNKGTTLKPNAEALKMVAKELGISVGDARLGLSVFNDVDPMAIMKGIKKPVPKIKATPKKRAVIPEGPIKAPTTGKQETILPPEKGTTRDMFEVAKEKAKPKPEPGRVYVKDKFRPFTEYKEFTRKGKNQGKIQVTLPDGKKVIVEKSSVKRWPGEAKKEVTLETFGFQTLFLRLLVFRPCLRKAPRNSIRQLKRAR
jgi:hypothetical protein